MASFVHLHCHSEYSILECPIQINALIEKAVDANMQALALTDNASMYGAIDFYQKAKHAGINPVLGADLYITENIKQKKRWEHRLVLLAMSFKGYQQLMKIISKAHLEGMYYKPRVDLETCAEFSEDIIAISPGGRGIVANYLQQHNEEKALEVARYLKETFSDRFYLGVQRVDGPYEDLVESGYQTLSKELSVPIVAMNNVYTLKSEDAMLRDVLFCIQTGKQLDDSNAAQLQGSQLYFKSIEEMQEVFQDHPEWLEESVAIASRCKVDIEMEQVLLPRFQCPDNKSSETYLEELIWQGIHERYGAEVSETIKERVRFELDIIVKMQYANYFLIIYDFLHFCRSNQIPVGPGRGSAAGSIVAYALDITKCDPIRYNLLFERFLNPERVSMPDIDIDFCIKRREEVIQYIVEKYGQECVSQIITFGTMQARAVIRDVGRALNVPLSTVDRIAKLIPSTPGSYLSIAEALEQISELKQSYDSQDDIRELLDIAIKLEGLTRHTSTHAAGVVISRDPLETVVPLTQNDGQIATQYAMANIEQIGLLKMDILGLRNLTVIQDTMNMIQETRGIVIDINTIPMADKPTFDMLVKGLGVGVFQCESKGMRQLMKDMQPTVFEDLIALLALYRPGPLGSGMVSDFVSNKLGKTQVKYPLPECETILKETYGMILYQEQVMQIASEVGGFSLGQADMLRRAMGKKKKDVMDAMRLDFMNGAKNKSIDIKKAGDVFDLCYKFAEYGFNKSHSTAYALVSYQTAYLKANYSIEYLASLLSSVVSNSEKTSLYIQECNVMGIAVLPPCVNSSRYMFTVDRDPDNQDRQSIRFGLSAIKNVGDGAIESIVEHAPYKDLADIAKKVDLRQCNKRVFESLIKAGAMDAFGERSYLLAIFETVMERAAILIKEQRNGQVGLFGATDVGSGFSNEEIHTDNYRVYSPQEKLKFEKEMMGLYISGHPLDIIKEELMHAKTPIKSLQESHQHKIVSITGFLSECRRIVTKNKKEMLLGTLEDLTGTMTVLVFQDDTFEKKAEVFQDDHIVTITGRVRISEEEVSINCQELVLIDRSEMTKSLYIDIDNLSLDVLKKVKALNLEFKGTFPVYLKSADTTLQVHQKFWVVEDEYYRVQLEHLVGKGRVWIV